ncbi:MAG TPA: type II toxin-antitoxin system VapC family toxin [Pilimelia sp.]|nr:type II toxin-antitoxin system VapC family toxin [Pilimelia sp.]
MIVVDASAMVAALLGGDARADAALTHLHSHAPWYAPAHMPVEVVRTFAKLQHAGLATAEAAEGLAMQMHRGVGAAVVLTGTRELLPEIWRLRHNISPYDGAYVALAAHLGAPLLTADRRLAKAAIGLAEVLEI